jgi:predicted ribonuclease YlaK
MTDKRKPRTAVLVPEHLEEFVPFSDNQAKAHKHWKKGKNLVLSGSPGTGKTFLALSFALKEVLPKNSEYEKVIIIRSIVPTREIGFLPGDEDEKKEAYAAPYKALLTELTETSGAWNMATTANKIDFESTSFIRGLTLDNCIIVVDEMQNLNFHELDSVITRVGMNSKIIFCGDYHQSDFKNSHEKNGIKKFLEILDHMESFEIVNFGWHDIVRSDFVRDYIMTKEMIEEELKRKNNEKISSGSGPQLQISGSSKT